MFGRRRPTGLPRASTDAERRALSDIEEYGWHCLLVADEHHPHHAEAIAAMGPHEVYDATFAYTVGVWGTWHHPELVLVGRWQHAHAYLSALVDMIEDGARFSPGDTTDELLEGYEVRFGAVSDFRRTELLTWSDWANARRRFEAVQVILPDLAGKWPDEDGYEGFPQPLLRPDAD